ncbi:MAG: hypothetical protein HUJ56_08580, partial [Erysipelotrichaceae bacterium]|nr:hypothetical protein [Erysipelotrichaceae bacterium]
MSFISVALIVAINVDYYMGFYNIPVYMKSIMKAVALLMIILITVLMYKRLALAFGHGGIYLLGLLLLNPIFLLLIGLSKDYYHEELAQMEGNALKTYLRRNQSLGMRIVNNIILIVIGILSVVYMGYIIINRQQPAFILEKNNKEFAETLESNVKGDINVIYPAKNTNIKMEVRDLYYPNVEDAKEVTIHMYMIGSDLEDAAGLATVNLNQMLEATKASSNLKFIVEAGGSYRWIIKDIKDQSVGRYMIQDGKITELAQLGKISMSNPQTLEDFLIWANEEYPCERQMLYFWDHGAGIRGFGYDMYVERQGSKVLSIPEIVTTLANAKCKYELINFDACLMQTLEIGTALEPYADYLLASEETEPGYGDYYQLPFTKLAENPGMRTEDFAASVITTYDEYLQVCNDGEPYASATLSLVDLRRVPTIQKAFTSWVKSKSDEFIHNKESFINLSQAHARAYGFMETDQIDLIDFLSYNSDGDETSEDLIEMVDSAIVIRNANSAEHIYGMAFYMPYSDISYFSEYYSVLKELGLDNEIDAYNEFASIMGSQKSTADNQHFMEDFSAEEWYVKGFENYNASLFKENLALVEVDDGYTVDLSEDELTLVTDISLGMKVKSGDKYADLGKDDLFAHRDTYSLTFDGTWLSIAGIPVSVKPESYQLTDTGEEYICSVPAVLDLVLPINIYVKRTVKDGVITKAEVLGYLEALGENNEGDNSTKGYSKFSTGSFVSFAYDWYYEDGNFKCNSLGHWPVRVSYEGLKVEQMDMSGEEYEYYGILYDTMNRRMETE